jgi:hypothetical protein
MAKKTSSNPDPEIAAISEAYAALQELDSDAQFRVLKYVTDKLRLTDRIQTVTRQTHSVEPDDTRETKVEAELTEPRVDDDAELEGISPAGKKWITRSGIKTDQLSSIFSIGGDEIDLIAKSVPGDSKPKKMRSVILLKGLASYLGTGAARLTDQEIRETCLHYGALDANNYAAHMGKLTSEVTGSKETGYTLSARGQAAATEMVKGMVTSGAS